MSNWGKVDFSQLQEWQKRLDVLQQEELNRFIVSTSKELAARLLQKVQGYTPVGRYKKRVGGTLRRGWTGKKDMDPVAYALTLPVSRVGSGYLIKVINPVEYASYVEYGHRTRNGKGWVEGRFMLTRSEMELESALPGIIEKKLKRYLTKVFKP